MQSRDNSVDADSNCDCSQCKTKTSPPAAHSSLSTHWNLGYPPFTVTHHTPPYGPNYANVSPMRSYNYGLIPARSLSHGGVNPVTQVALGLHMGITARYKHIHSPYSVLRGGYSLTKRILGSCPSSSSSCSPAVPPLFMNIPCTLRPSQPDGLQTGYPLVSRTIPLGTLQVTIIRSMLGNMQRNMQQIIT
ncbi:hypothetical protein L211DRAFT_464080 [Terfezia boudieri ATCC MYA-4762]|uniref:Uncharacterized protein n=1 Tax=Terfezia boudieri ATCC MYA-4762 TaxID=1051890 RepID=A0A3N4LHQ5_9PEZI|nr:hypothetical protein L211DRAFT_464080 [Terfezia boudieri ATCC MYA-4762]